MVAVAERLAEAGAGEVVLADTIGVATPAAVRSSDRKGRRARRPAGGHFHNTRNTGYANALAALDAGATVLDASVGGLGGCPFAPRATGNIATEDLVYLLHGEGLDTGIDSRARRRLPLDRRRARPGLARTARSRWNTCGLTDPQRPEGASMTAYAAAAVPDPRRWKALVLLCAAFFMVVLDVAIVNVALPSIRRDLNFSPDNLQWVITAYSLTFGGFLLLGGRAADLLGRRLVFMVGVAIFTPPRCSAGSRSRRRG